MTESNAIQAFNFADAGQELKKKLRLAFAEMIPDEQWEQLLQAEFTKFTTVTHVKNTYSHGTTEHPSDLSVIAQDVLKEMANEALRQAFETAGFAVKLEEKLNAHVAEHKEEILQEFVSKLIFGGIATAMQHTAKAGYAEVMKNFKYDEHGNLIIDQNANRGY